MHRLSYANVTASVALFLALGGTSVAATNLVNGKNIKKGSIPANRIQAHSLGGMQINAASLGVVPHAGRADSAGHADTATSAGSASRADSAGHADDAGHADTAGDAATLGGKSAAQLL